MENEREAVGPQARSEPAFDARELNLRLLLAERGIAESARRIGELTEALARLANLAQSTAAPGEQTVVVDADAVSPFSLGFYHREFDKLGRPFRWTGKSDIFEFRLGLDRNAAWSFAIELQPNPNVDMKKLRAFVDYVEVPAEIDDSGKFVTGRIPERLFGTSVTVSFLLPNRFVPSAINPAAQDSRQLGIIFYEMRLTMEQAQPAEADGLRAAAEAGANGQAAAAPKLKRRSPRPSSGVAESST
jgi:hypothetical protein